MKSLKKNWLKIIAIVVLCACLDLILHALVVPINSSNEPFLKPSIFVERGLLIPTLSAYALIDFGILAVVFLFIEHNLIGKKWIKGFLYGLSFGGLYFIGMFEGILLWNDSVSNSFLMGIVDLIPILLMGTLLGIFIGTNETKVRKRQNVLSIFIIAFCFIIGRYFSYYILNITSACNIKPLGTFIWTLCLGLWIGLICFFLQLVNKEKSPISKGLLLGIVVCGLNWLMYHFFIAIIAEVSFIDIFLRVGLDVSFTILGLLVWNKLSEKYWVS